MRFLKPFFYMLIFLIVFLSSGYLTINILLKRQTNVICPDVRGKTVEEAKRLLEKSGLSLIVSRYERRNDVPLNHITVQKPEANISTRLGRTVMVIVSEGPELIPLPVLEGKSIANAEEILREKNIQISKIIYAPHQMAGKVIAQMPKGGEDVIKGKGITLLVGTEENKYYIMPETKDMTTRDLTEEMNNKNIKYNLNYILNEQISAKINIIASIPPRTIFKNDKEIEIKVLTGG
ncbi:MAG: Serine/threonine-protein kinase PK-1 [Deltaproteobacteria bacterium ADurb.Bin026]|nr:MAG: Serine/threonine-protein kinase PK-1 [Deltaproteobacteria bacterium ADurb.Bin026]